MIRRGSVVSFIAALVANHPIYSQASGEFKVARIIDRKGKKFAKLENGVKVPVILLQGVPQKKGRGLPVAAVLQMGKSITVGRVLDGMTLASVDAYKRAR